MLKLLKDSWVGLLIMAAVLMVFLAGCQKMTAAQKLQVASAAAASREDATSFAAVATTLTTSNANESSQNAVFVDIEQKSVNEEAAALKNISDAVNSGSDLQIQTRDELVSLQNTLRVDLRVFQTWRKKLALNDSQKLWADNREARLQDLTDTITKILNGFAKPKSSTTTPKK